MININVVLTPQIRHIFDDAICILVYILLLIIILMPKFSGIVCFICPCWQLFGSSELQRALISSSAAPDACPAPSGALQNHIVSWCLWMGHDLCRYSERFEYVLGKLKARFASLNFFTASKYGAV